MTCLQHLCAHKRGSERACAQGGHSDHPRSTAVGAGHDPPLRVPRLRVPHLLLHRVALPPLHAGGCLALCGRSAAVSSGSAVCGVVCCALERCGVDIPSSLHRCSRTIACMHSDGKHVSQAAHHRRCTAGAINGGFFLYTAAQAIASAAQGKRSWLSALSTTLQCAVGLASMAASVWGVLQRGANQTLMLCCFMGPPQ